MGVRQARQLHRRLPQAVPHPPQPHPVPLIHGPPLGGRGARPGRRPVRGRRRHRRAGACDGADAITVQRTFATARSVEFDALVLVGVPAPGAEALGARDAKAGGTAKGTVAVDPRLALLVSEAFRHAKAIGGWADAEHVLNAATGPADAPGVVLADSGGTVLAGLTPFLAKHRVWDRFPATI
ncbi:hypothetical protein [Streptomyces sp. NPDC004330]|uniref:hypothetical protein n=1 Tax=Streptomyces sp. NPDC004330 TaxID=3364700 RepID=UPI00368573E2